MPKNEARTCRWPSWRSPASWEARRGDALRIQVRRGDLGRSAVVLIDSRHRRVLLVGRDIGQLGAKVLVGVVERVVDDGRIRAGELGSEPIQILLDHDPISPFSTASTKSRVRVHSFFHSERIDRPSSVML